MVLLRTVHWKVLWGTKTGSSMVSLCKPPLEPLFLRVYLALLTWANEQQLFGFGPDVPNHPESLF